MVTTPQGQDLSVVLNAIRSTSSSAYQSTVPAASASNIKDVGAAVLAAPTAIRNEFMSNLYNKVGLTLIDTPVIENEFAFLKKGTLEYGQTIEDLYVGIAQADKYSTGMKDGDTVPDQFALKRQHISVLSILLFYQDSTG
jgi:transcription termination factor Rho